MRFVFLLPDYLPGVGWQTFEDLVERSRLKPLQNWYKRKFIRTDVVHGGDLNIMRHCWVARNAGVDAVIATFSGRDTFQDRASHPLPYIRWADRRADDICLVPDWLTYLIDDVEGPVIAYLQVPTHTRADFDYRHDRISLWTDSPFMKEICEKNYPGREIEIVPNVVDNGAFPFVPQEEREQGLVFAFPRKGPEYIAATKKLYREMGGTYWKFELVDGISLKELAKEFQRPQVFLASGQVEGCALPPQESMASGVVVVGRTARGANFCMEHRETAMTAETPEAAAKCLIELEDLELRQKIAKNGHEYISQYFPTGEPLKFWKDVIQRYTSSNNLLPL